MQKPIYYLVFIAIGTVLIASQLTNQNTVVFSLEPLAIKNVQNPNIRCYLQTELIEYDINGKQIKLNNSNFFLDSPYTNYSISNRPLDRDIDRYTLELFAKCSSVPINTELKFVKSDLQTKVYAVTSDATYEIYNAKKSFTEKKLPNSVWESVAQFSIKGADLEKKWLPDGKYDANLKFEIVGNVNIAYDGYEKYAQVLKVENNDITVLATVNVEKNFNPPPTCEQTKTCYEPIVCESPSIIVDGICSAPSEPESSDDYVTSEPKTEGFFECASSVDLACLADSRYFGYYMFGLIGLVVLAVVAQKKVTYVGSKM